MSTFKDMDKCLPILRVKMEQEKQPIRKAGIKIAIDIIQALPSVEVTDGVSCDECFFYAKAEKRCNHRNGLQGRVRPQMYCAYGSRVYADTQEELDDTAFTEFEEGD